MSEHTAGAINPAHSAPYIVGAAFAFLTFVFAIRWFRAKRMNGIAVGSAASIAFGILSMIKIRCASGDYPCGFMAFTGGFTWHFVPGFFLFVGLWGVASVIGNAFHRIGWLRWAERVGRSGVPLLGLWLAVLWETMPVHYIHPPAVGGVCPSLPVICHDVPVAGRGGLGFWVAPFILWALAVIVWDLLKLAKDGRSVGNQRAQSGHV